MTSISSISSAFPTDVIGNIFHSLPLSALGVCSRVCKVWSKEAEKQINTFFPEKAFGPKEWFIHFKTRLKNIPRLPPDIADILSSSCPFWPGKKVHETHLLVLVPQTVNGRPLTLKTLGELVKKPRQGHSTQYSYFHLGGYTDLAAPPSHWVLLTRDVIKGSRKKSYLDQQVLLNQPGHGIYAVPTILDAIICIFMEYVRSGTRLYSDKPWTYTRCQENFNANWQLSVGGFAWGGLSVSYSISGDRGLDGIAGSRKI
jgi:hypothetical protein